MGKNFDYTGSARKFVNRFPVVDHLLTQVSFWIISFMFLAVLAHLVIAVIPSQQINFSLPASLIIAVFLGLCNGLISGFMDSLFEKRFFFKKALGFIILIKTVIGLFVFVILISVVRYSIYPFLATRLTGNNNVIGERSWDSFFYLLLIYNIVAGLVISFINQVNKKFGPGVLLPLLLGKYRSPREEERIFLFMDLKSSTSIAEALGHLKYSAFIRDSFMDINEVLSSYHAEVYQYVGDEIVLTWTIKEGLHEISCIRFFFACEKKFEERSAHYIKQFGQVPQFKAGLHMGKVTVVEVGNVKRDIAYHGDTLNTAARIQSVCNEYNKRFLVSQHMIENSEAERYYQTESLGMIALKGKKQPVEIASIDNVKTVE
jgi:adenylate cyclase